MSALGFKSTASGRAGVNDLLYTIRVHNTFLFRIGKFLLLIRRMARGIEKKDRTS